VVEATAFPVVAGTATLPVVDKWSPVVEWTPVVVALVELEAPVVEATTPEVGLVEFVELEADPVDPPVEFVEFKAPVLTMSPVEVAATSVLVGLSYISY
jgi:hypothetical protein